MATLRRTIVVIGLVLLVLWGTATAATAHEERGVTLPDGSGSVPAYRTGPDADALLVCKTDAGDFARRVADFPAPLRERNLRLFDRCQRDGFRHLQSAVDAVSGPGARILMLPGEYHEEPSLRPSPAACADLPAYWTQLGAVRYQVLSYDQQRRCPHSQNLVAILGIEDLQIEGTGADPLDVVLDARYRTLNALRADRADGLYLHNLTVQRTQFNAVYVIETDGFVIDGVTARWNEEYGFLTFAVDHGLYDGCEAYGNGDSGVYPGSASNLNAGNGYDVDRYAVEIRNCHSHHNLLGYSGTAGDSVWAHDNVFTDNAAGVSMDSAFPGHPGLPQNHALFESNFVAGNDSDYYRHVRDGTCAKPIPERGYEHGVVCPAVGVPVGTGILTAGGNYNTFRDNHVYDQPLAGFMLFAVPAFIRGETALSKQTDTSHHNRYLDNVMGVGPDGQVRPNGVDFWWDGQGAGNCWQGQRAASNPRPLPACGAPPTDRLAGAPLTLAKNFVCSEYDLVTANVPAGCDWYGASGLGRVQAQLTLGAVVLLAAVAGVLWWRLLRGSRLGVAVTVVGLAGLALVVVATGFAGTALPMLAYLLIGAWQVGAGVVVRGSGRRRLGTATIVLGVLALVHAVDAGLWMLPWVPVGPGWLRLLLTPVWILWVVGAVADRRQREPAAEAGPQAVTS